MVHGPARAESGEVRYLILDSLREQPCHGYQIIQNIEQISGGRYRPSPGTVYPTLQMLEELGHVTAHKEGSRTLYAITGEGRADLEAHRADVEAAYGRLKGEPFLTGEVDFSRLAPLAQRLRQTLRAAHRRGSLGRQEFSAIFEVLEETVQKIEGILDPGPPQGE
jgi:DNA-binding PadR family transcriptional regulator